MWNTMKSLCTCFERIKTHIVKYIIIYVDIFVLYLHELTQLSENALIDRTDGVSIK